WRSGGFLLFFSKHVYSTTWFPAAFSLSQECKNGVPTYPSTLSDYLHTARFSSHLSSEKKWWESRKREERKGKRRE
ncbi:hypothetical protein QBC32DRAFT_347588, partial [Pseudoneurospora amorphoporcata]